MSIQVKNIDKRFGAFHALNNISLDFPEGQLVALLGPSGCGKTTLLRIIAGLEAADQGQVILEGQDATNVHVRERQVGFVFQHYALFRHMTVFDNIAFGLRVRPRSTRPSEAEIKKRVDRLLDLVQLGFLADRYPAQLSGGQRQRIALARALAVEPRVLLLDEPFAGVDPIAVEDIQNIIIKLQERGLGILITDHNVRETLRITERAYIMAEGSILISGTSDQIANDERARKVYLGDNFKLD